MNARPITGSWPTFNIADVLLLVGVGLLFFYLRAYEKTEAEQDDEDEDADTDVDQPAASASKSG